MGRTAMRGSAKPQNPVQLWDSPLNYSNVKSYFVALEPVSQDVEVQVLLPCTDIRGEW